MWFDEQEIGRPPVEEEKSAQHPLILDSIDEPESDHEEEGNTSDDAPAAEVMPRRSTREFVSSGGTPTPAGTSMFTM